jgi:hypothetical protein
VTSKLTSYSGIAHATMRRILPVSIDLCFTISGVRHFADERIDFIAVYGNIEIAPYLFKIRPSSYKLYPKIADDEFLS